MEMALISPGGENLLDFLEVGKVLLTYDGTSVTRYVGLRKGQAPCESLGGGTWAPLDEGGTHVLPLEWRRVCRGTS